MAGQRRAGVLIMHAPVGRFVRLPPTSTSTSTATSSATSSLPTVALIFQVAAVVVAARGGWLRLIAVEHVK